MSKAYNTVSQSVCHRLSFGTSSIPSRCFDKTGRHCLWIHIISLTVMTKYSSKSEIVSNVDCLSIHLVLHKHFSLRFLGVVQTDATTPNNVGACSASWEGYNP